MSYNHLVVTKDYDGRFMSFAQQARQMIREDQEMRETRCKQACRELGERMGASDPAVSDEEFSVRWEAFWDTVPDDAVWDQITEIVQRKLAELDAAMIGG